MLAVGGLQLRIRQRPAGPARCGAIVDLTMGPAVLAVSWGDVPTWLSSAASSVALIFGVVAVVIARRTFRIESERDRLNAELRGRQDSFARRSQAALISAWWGSAPDRDEWGVYLRNASETPVYQSHATITDPGDPGEATRIRLVTVPPTSEPVFHPVRLAAADRRVGLTFTDAAGVRWARDTYGRLTELEPRLTIWGAERMEAVLAKFADDFLAAYGSRLHTTPTSFTNGWIAT